MQQSWMQFGGALDLANRILQEVQFHSADVRHYGMSDGRLVP